MSSRMQYRHRLKIALFRKPVVSYLRILEKVQNAKRPDRKSWSRLVVFDLPRRIFQSTLRHSSQYGCKERGKWIDEVMNELDIRLLNITLLHSNTERTYYMLAALSSLMIEDAKWTKARGVYWHIPFCKLSCTALQAWYKNISLVSHRKLPITQML